MIAKHPVGSQVRENGTPDWETGFYPVLVLRQIVLFL